MQCTEKSAEKSIFQNFATLNGWLSFKRARGVWSLQVLRSITAMLELEIDENWVFFGTLESHISAETANFLACGTPIDPGGWCEFGMVPFVWVGWGV